jgi:hypothetical protein
MLEALTVLATAGKLHDIGVRAGIKPVLQELDDHCLDSPAVRYTSNCFINHYKQYIKARAVYRALDLGRYSVYT